MLLHEKEKRKGEKAFVEGLKSDLRKKVKRSNSTQKRYKTKPASKNTLIQPVLEVQPDADTEYFGTPSADSKRQET